jgi:hypothetical protein
MCFSKLYFQVRNTAMQGWQLMTGDSDLSGEVWATYELFEPLRVGTATYSTMHRVVLADDAL